jgi:predicted acyltransferase
MQATALEQPAILSAGAAEKRPGAGRVMSVDALRGFDMFWIVGGSTVVRALPKLCGDRFTGRLASEMKHCEWQGFNFLDLVLPLFIFLVGVSVVFSLRKALARDGRRAALIRIVRRTVLLVLLGVFYSGGVAGLSSVSAPGIPSAGAPPGSWGDVRWVGVLQRIALAYCAASLLFCYFRPRVLAAVTVALLLGYWAVLELVPIRDIRLDDATFQQLSSTTGLQNERQIFLNTTATVKGRLEPGYNLTHHLDFLYVPGRLWFKRYDGETILGNVVSIASCLMGVFAGLLLTNPRRTDGQKCAWLLGGGAAAVAVAFLWSFQLPLIKLLSTPSFVLMAGGYSALLLGVFYWLIDMRGWRLWCRPFVWIGMNAITVYIAVNVLTPDGFIGLGARLVGGPVSKLLDSLVAPGTGELAVAIAGVGLMLLFVRFLWRKQIFLRV